MLAYLANTDESFTFKALKNKVLFLAACCLPLFYLIWRLIFFTSAEYHASLPTHFHYFLVGMGNLFNVLYIYGYRHSLWRPNIPMLAAATIVIVYLFDSILLLIGISIIKNAKKVFSDRRNLLILSLIFFSCVIFPVNGGGRLQFLYLFFSFLFIGRFAELHAPNHKMRIFFLLPALVMIIASVYISFSCIFETMSPASPAVIKEDLKTFNDIAETNKYLLRDEFKVQYDNLKSKVETEQNQPAK